MYIFDINYRYIIPYMRKDSPAEKSKFSSNILTIVLTCMYYYNSTNNIYGLEKKDIILIKNKNEREILTKIGLIYEISNILKLKGSDIYNEMMMKKIEVNENYRQRMKNIVKDYIRVIFLNYNISSEIKNISFIDMCNLDCFWQVGYTGTVNIKLDIPEGNPYNRYSTKIIYDDDENMNLKLVFDDTESQ